MTSIIASKGIEIPLQRNENHEITSDKQGKLNGGGMILYSSNRLFITVVLELNVNKSTPMENNAAASMSKLLHSKNKALKPRALSI